MNEPALRPSGYLPRIVDGQIERYLHLFGAVEVGGTRWCGKTWSSLAHANSVIYIDRGGNLELAKADPDYALDGSAPHVIDEWQRVPAIWDHVRHKVDALSGSKGCWILTGSSTPASGEVEHSGAGRIGRIRMHPMSLAESGDSSGTVSLSGLFDGMFTPCEAETGISNLAHLCVRGGWPALLDSEAEDAQETIREYLSAIFQQSIQKMGGSQLISERLSRSLARNLGQSPKLSTLSKDVYALDDDDRDPTNDEQQTVSRHIDLLERLYLIDSVPGWIPPSRSPKRMRSKPKRYYADPSLPVSLLGLSVKSLMQDWQTFGLVFENLCMRDFDVYARALPGVGFCPVRYYRDDSGLEIDVIIERSDLSWGAIEVKLSSDLETIEAAAASLKRMRDKLGKDKQARTPSPSFLAVVTGTGERAYRRPDGIYVIPIRVLGA